MRAMKDSGVEWIGCIPADWETGRIGGLYTHRNEKVSDYDYAPLSVTMQGIVPQLETAAKTDDHNNRKLVKAGDFAINSRSDRRGSCGISAYDGSVSLINTVLKPHETMCPGYYNYLFYTTEFADEFYRMGHGIVDDLWTTRWADMKTIRVPLPSLVEQQRIAYFLDGCRTDIDTQKAVLEKEVDALRRLKKALITQAVGPNDTNCIALKRISARVFDGPFGSNLKGKDYIDSGVRVVRLENLKYLTFDDSKRSYVSEEKYRTICSHTVIPGDLVMSTFVSGEVDVCELPPTIPHAVNKADCIGIRLLDDVCRKYLMYALSSDWTYHYLQLYGHGATRFRVNTAQIKTIPIPVRSFERQQVIAAYLDERCAAIDSVIEIRTKQISRLEDYRRALIFQYVTGKKEVPA
jgi:type I restriction enzyme S subunit